LIVKKRPTTTTAMASGIVMSRGGSCIISP
jgi:hypothetical protein